MRTLEEKIRQEMDARRLMQTMRQCRLSDGWTRLFHILEEAIKSSIIADEIDNKSIKSSIIAD